jgi:hypothetical protein
MTGIASRQLADIPVAGRQWHGQEHTIELRDINYRLRLFSFAAGWLASLDTVEGPTLGCNRSPYLAVSRAVEPIGGEMVDAMLIVSALSLPEALASASIGWPRADHGIPRGVSW